MDELLIVCHMHFNTWQGEIVTGTEIYALSTVAVLTGNSWEYFKV